MKNLTTYISESQNKSEEYCEKYSKYLTSEQCKFLLDFFKNIMEVDYKMSIQRYIDIADRAFSDLDNERYNEKTEAWFSQYSDYISDVDEWFDLFVCNRNELKHIYKDEYDLFDKFAEYTLKDKYSGKKSFEMAYKFITELKEKMEHIGLLY